MPQHDICSVILIPQLPLCFFPVASVLLSSCLFASFQLPLCFFLSEKEDVFPLKLLHRAEVGGAFLETDGNRGHDFPDDV